MIISYEKRERIQNLIEKNMNDLIGVDRHILLLVLALIYDLHEVEYSQSTSTTGDLEERPESCAGKNAPTLTVEDLQTMQKCCQEASMLLAKQNTPPEIWQVLAPVLDFIPKLLMELGRLQNVTKDLRVLAFYNASDAARQ